MSLYAEGVANQVAKAAGDVNAGIVVVERIGMTVKKEADLHQRHFEVVESGETWVHLRVPAAAQKAGYIWKYGITPVKDTPPTVFSPLLFTLSVEIIITNLQSGTIVGCQYSSILPERMPSFSDGAEPVQYGDFIYFVIP